MAVALVPEEAVKEITTQAERLEQAAQALVVQDEATLQEATNMVAWVAKAKKAIEEKRQFFVKPLQEQVKRVNELFKQYAAPLDRADTLLRGKILAYRQEQERKRREEEERLRKLAEKEQKRLEKQAAKNGMPAPPPIVVPSPPPMAKTVQSEMGAAQVRTVWDFEIVDETQIPREFLMPNVPAIRAAVKAGVRNIPGVRIFQREDLAVRAK